MQKTIKNIGLDVHKNSISIGIADDGRDGEVRYYGVIDNNMDQLDKVIRKLISKGAALRFVYEAGPCGYGIYRYLTKCLFRKSKMDQGSFQLVIYYRDAASCTADRISRIYRYCNRLQQSC